MRMINKESNMSKRYAFIVVDVQNDHLDPKWRSHRFNTSEEPILHQINHRSFMCDITIASRTFHPKNTTGATNLIKGTKGARLPVEITEIADYVTTKEKIGYSAFES